MNSNEPITDKHEPDSHTVNMTAVYTVKSDKSDSEETYKLECDSKWVKSVQSRMFQFWHICKYLRGRYWDPWWLRKTGLCVLMMISWRRIIRQSVTWRHTIFGIIKDVNQSKEPFLESHPRRSATANPAVILISWFCKKTSGFLRGHMINGACKLRIWDSVK